VVTEEVTVPLDVRLRFGRAAVQVVANRVGARLLHIKGDVVDPSLRSPRAGSDVDIIVRPSDVAPLDRAIRQEGWRLYSSFFYGSPFGHAQTYVHDAWGYLDLHRSFPGIRLDPSLAFEVLARDAGSINDVGVECPVPGIDAQTVVVILNAARAEGSRSADVRRIWGSASPEDQERLIRLVRELKAEVAFAAATGDLERYRDRSDYTLWRVISHNGPRSAEWWGRIRAAGSAREALALVARAPRVNVEQLRHDLGREPTRREIVLEFVRRGRRAISEGWAWVWGWRK
jgi:hypothetical protein